MATTRDSQRPGTALSRKKDDCPPRKVYSDISPGSWHDGFFQRKIKLQLPAVIFVNRS